MVKNIPETFTRPGLERIPTGPAMRWLLRYFNTADYYEATALFFKQADLFETEKLLDKMMADKQGFQDFVKLLRVSKEQTVTTLRAFRKSFADYVRHQIGISGNVIRLWTREGKDRTSEEGVLSVCIHFSPSKAESKRVEFNNRTNVYSVIWSSPASCGDREFSDPWEAAELFKTLEPK